MNPATVDNDATVLADAELAQRIAAGDQQAFVVLMRRFKQTLYRTAPVLVALFRQVPPCIVGTHPGDGGRHFKLRDVKIEDSATEKSTNFRRRTWPLRRDPW